jgi:hypothetical protein
VHGVSGAAPSFTIGEYVGYVGCWGSRCYLYTCLDYWDARAVTCDFWDRRETGHSFYTLLFTSFLSQVGEVPEPATGGANTN